MSHAELDQATELDDGDPDDLAARYVELRERMPNLNVLGGCCGTDHRHVARDLRRRYLRACSTTRAQRRPSAIAVTTSEAPTRASPAA